MKYNHIFVEAKREGYPLSIFTESELKWIKSKDLIEIVGTNFQSAFVGELITPENSYFSLPKNFAPTEDNITLFKQVLTRYKDLKGSDGRTLLTNTTFASNLGNIKSEKFYYNELKEFFLDYITYEYIYPDKTLKVHSSSPISGKIDVFSTMRNIKQKGPGITYNAKDIVNSPDWNIDDIYYSTITNLMNQFGSDDDKIQIKEMVDFLRSEGYILNITDVSDKKQVIKDIKKCDVGIIHKPIQNTLLDYYELISLGERYSINAFYTNKFQYVWEELVRISLKHNAVFKKSLDPVFKRTETRSKWFSNKQEVEEFIVSNRIKEHASKGIPSGIRLIYTVASMSIPDLFSEYKGKQFIGDAKYYKDPENSQYEKEFRTYNTLTNNEYPMVIFVPGSRTKVLHVRRENELELVIFEVSVRDAINDAINNKNDVIDRVHSLLYDKGNTDR